MRRTPCLEGCSGVDTLGRPSWYGQNALLSETNIITHKLLEKPIRVKILGEMYMLGNPHTRLSRTQQGGGAMTFSPFSVCSWPRFHIESITQISTAKIWMLRMILYMMIFHFPPLPKWSFFWNGEVNGHTTIGVKITSKINIECGWPETGRWLPQE